MLEFKGVTAIVPGTSSDAGRTCALFYALMGSKVLVSDINTGRLGKPMQAAELVV